MNPSETQLGEAVEQLSYCRMDLRRRDNTAAERLFPSCGPEIVRENFNARKAKN